VLHVLANRVTAMDPAQGLVANAGTSLLVLAASPLGLPVSTTHVSTGALMGIRFVEKRLPRQADALRAILFAWVVTLPVAAMLAAATATLMGLASSS
jgi:inorganic phosphate transporter, PiT family